MAVVERGVLTQDDLVSFIYCTLIGDIGAGCGMKKKNNTLRIKKITNIIASRHTVHSHLPEGLDQFPGVLDDELCHDEEEES